MENNKFDYLLPKMTKDLTQYFLNNLQTYPEFIEDIDTSPLLNLTIGTFVGSLINLLDEIKNNTIGEIKLIENIELTKNTLIKSIENLPFIQRVEFI